jgi:hypothetical protein
MPTMNGMTLYHKIKEIDNNVLIIVTTLLLIKIILKLAQRDLLILIKLFYTNQYY